MQKITDRIDLLDHLKETYRRVTIKPVQNNAATRDRMVYVLEEIDGRRAIGLNRRYKPCGHRIPRGVWVNYACFRPSHVDLAALPALDSGVWTDASDAARRWLFDDGSAPWCGRAAALAYAGRLEVLIEALESYEAARGAIGRARQPAASIVGHLDGAPRAFGALAAVTNRCLTQGN